MTITLSTQVVGLKELEQVLRELPAELVSRAGGPVKLALKAASDPVFQDALANVPVDTGRLKQSIVRRRHPNPRYLNEIFGIGVDPGKTRGDEDGAWYGNIVEYNTPFLRPALEKNRRKSTQIYAIQMGTRIERIGRKLGNENARKVGAKVNQANQPTSVQNLLNYRPPA